MSKVTFKIADAIMDSAAEEYRQENLSGIGSVQRYAENAWFPNCSYTISDGEAMFILHICRNSDWHQNLGIFPEDFWWQHFEKPLLNY